MGALAMTMKWVARGRAKSPLPLSVLTPGGLGESTNLSNVTWGELMQGSVLAEKNCCFQLNFSNDVFTIIAEAELMEQLGFALEPCIRNVAVQKDRLHRDLEAVQAVLEEYNAIVQKLTVAEVRTLINFAAIDL